MYCRKCSRSNGNDCLRSRRINDNNNDQWTNTSIIETLFIEIVFQSIINSYVENNKGSLNKVYLLFLGTRTTTIRTSSISLERGIQLSSSSPHRFTSRLIFFGLLFRTIFFNWISLYVFHVCACVCMCVTVIYKYIYWRDSIIQVHRFSSVSSPIRRWFWKWTVQTTMRIVMIMMLTSAYV